MATSISTNSLDTVAPAALALAPESRAALADLLLSSLEPAAGKNVEEPMPDAEELSVEEMAERLTSHFHRAKQAALQRAEALNHGGLTNAAQE